MPSMSFAEALGAAVKVEESGMAFYKAAAANAEDPAAAEVFLGLAEFEKKHLDHFAALAARAVSDTELFRDGSDGDFAKDLATAAASSVFDLKKDISTFFGAKGSPRAAVRTAIGLEKDSIVFYLGLQKAMANRDEALKVSAIIDEEMRHISVLNGLLRQMA
jgi:rubrerythrin